MLLSKGAASQKRLRNTTLEDRYNFLFRVKLVPERVVKELLCRRNLNLIKVELRRIPSNLPNLTSSSIFNLTLYCVFVIPFFILPIIIDKYSQNESLYCCYSGKLVLNRQNCFTFLFSAYFRCVVEELKY